MCVRVADINRVCFLRAGRPDHPNRVVGQDAQVVPRMNSPALSVSIAGKTEACRYITRIARLQIRKKSRKREESER